MFQLFITWRYLFKRGGRNPSIQSICKFGPVWDESQFYVDELSTIAIECFSPLRKQAEKGYPEKGRWPLRRAGLSHQTSPAFCEQSRWARGCKWPKGGSKYFAPAARSEGFNGCSPSFAHTAPASGMCQLQTSRILCPVSSLRCALSERTIASRAIRLPAGRQVRGTSSHPIVPRPAQCHCFCFFNRQFLIV